MRSHDEELTNFTTWRLNLTVLYIWFGIHWTQILRPKVLSSCCIMHLHRPNPIIVSSPSWRQHAHGPSLPIPCENPFQLTWILYPTFANAFPPSLQPHPQQLNALPTPSQHLNPLNHTLKRLMCVCLSREVSAQVEQSETIDSEINPSSTDPLCCLDALNMWG